MKEPRKVIGIDVSKLTLDCALSNSKERFGVNNDEAGMVSRVPQPADHKVLSPNA